MSKTTMELYQEDALERSPGRGMLTPSVQAVSKEFLGKELTIRQLRLFPYLYFTMVDDQIIESKRINGEEMATLEAWEDENYLLLAPHNQNIRIVEMSFRFWSFISEVLFLSYVYREKKV